jgi:hypothetical protein
MHLHPFAMFVDGFHQLFVVDFVKETFDVHVDNPGLEGQVRAHFL